MKRAFAFCLVLAACGGRVPLPDRLRVSGIEELRARMEAAHSKVRGYSAEARLNYFGRDGRVKATATLVVARPASLRYDVQGPHGGVLTAFATNGRELEALDVTASRFVHGPATAHNLDRLLPFAPLDLGPEGWVALLFGEVSPPADASLDYDEKIGRFVVRWETHGTRRELEIDPETARPTTARAFRGETLVSEVQVAERDAEGVPAELRIAVPSEKAEVSVKLRDVEHDPELDPTVFVLDAPAGIAPERLGGGPEASP